MNDELLVRAYDVGFGDCIYIRVPDLDQACHILIDCGSSDLGGHEDALGQALKDVYEMLPQAPDGKRRLDLLVVTHKHRDHISGFDPELSWLKKMKIERIWLTAAMKKRHPDAQGFQALQDLEVQMVAQFDALGLQLSAGTRAVIENNIAPKKAYDALTVKLPQNNSIVPMYVFRGFENHQQRAERCFDALPEDPDRYQLHFQEPETRLRVLAPEWEIDRFYLGRGQLDALRGMGAHDAHLTRGVPRHKWVEGWPLNVSKSDFRRLRTRLMYAALAFSESNTHLINSTSVVLLLEWRGRRLLFTGDAEFQKRFKENSSNGSWDVMLHQPEVQGELVEHLDFLKVGHHGSANASPWYPEGHEQPILDAILPQSRKARLVISTLAGVHPGTKNPVPHPELMKELGRRAANAEKYQNDPEHPNTRQPPRTDLKCRQAGQPPYIEEALGPAPNWAPE